MIATDFLAETGINGRDHGNAAGLSMIATTFWEDGGGRGPGSWKSGGRGRTWQGWLIRPAKLERREGLAKVERRPGFGETGLADVGVEAGRGGAGRGWRMRRLIRGQVGSGGIDGYMGIKGRARTRLGIRGDEIGASGAGPGVCGPVREGLRKSTG
jgi:hypothetical protein